MIVSITTAAHQHRVPTGVLDWLTVRANLGSTIRGQQRTTVRPNEHRVTILICDWLSIRPDSDRVASRILHKLPTGTMQGSPIRRDQLLSVVICVDRIAIRISFDRTVRVLRDRVAMHVSHWLPSSVHNTVSVCVNERLAVLSSEKLSSIGTGDGLAVLIEERLGGAVSELCNSGSNCGWRSTICSAKEGDAPSRKGSLSLSLAPCVPTDVLLVSRDITADTTNIYALVAHQEGSHASHMTTAQASTTAATPKGSPGR
jgi:hypothetical protein